MDYLKAVILAVVEGLTEFLPISSTGHLILVEDLLRLDEPESFATAFMVIIQLPAILAVVVYFWKALWPFGHERGARGAMELWSRMAVAFLPAAALGFLLDDLIEHYLFNNVTVAVTLILGGVVLIALERQPREGSIHSVHDLTYMRAFVIGLFQCLAMIPGTSRSAATIVGGILIGCSRPVAAEFSFFLAIPTMLGATTLKILKGGADFNNEQWALLGVGSVVSFVVAYAVIAAFMSYVKRFSFAPFGYYRIVLGAIVLALWLAGVGGATAAE